MSLDHQMGGITDLTFLSNLRLMTEKMEAEGLVVTEVAAEGAEAGTNAEKGKGNDMSVGKPHREICGLCHEISRVGFWVPNKVWAATVHEHFRESIICLRCFTRLADEKQVQWDAGIKFYPVSWITHTTLDGD